MNQPPQYGNTNYYSNPSSPPKTNAKNTELKQAEQNPNSAHYYKNIGNNFFKDGEFEKAIENYSIAIKMNDTESVFYSNRARCYKILKNYKSAYQDAVQSVELDDDNLKGYILMGQLLAELGKEEESNDKFELAIKKLLKALSQCSKSATQTFEIEIKKTVARIKKVLSLKEIEKGKNSQYETLNYLMSRVKSDIASKDMVDENKLNDINSALSEHSEKTMELPDHLCCKITYELMEDPVITVSGVSYERHALEEHFKRNGMTDPVTREPVDPELVFPNQNFKEEIEAYLESNPWAFEYRPGETYKDVKF